MGETPGEIVCYCNLDVKSICYELGEKLLNVLKPNGEKKKDSDVIYRENPKCPPYVKGFDGMPVATPFFMLVFLLKIDQYFCNQKAAYYKKKGHASTKINVFQPGTLESW